MIIEPGETYFGHDSARLRVYRVDDASGTVIVEHPTLLRQETWPIARFEAWAREPYIPIDDRN